MVPKKSSGVLKLLVSLSFTKEVEERNVNAMFLSAVLGNKEKEKRGGNK